MKYSPPNRLLSVLPQAGLTFPTLRVRFLRRLCRPARRAPRGCAGLCYSSAASTTSPRELTGGAAPSLGLRRRGSSSGRWHPPGHRPPPHPLAPRGRPGAGLRDLFGTVFTICCSGKEEQEEESVYVCGGGINFAQWRQGSSLSPSIRSIY